MKLIHSTEENLFFDNRPVFEITEDGLRAGEAWNELAKIFRHSSEYLEDVGGEVVASFAIQHELDPVDAGEHLVDALEPPLDEVGRAAFMAGVRLEIDRRQAQQ